MEFISKTFIYVAVIFIAVSVGMHLFSGTQNALDSITGDFENSITSAVDSVVLVEG